MDGGRRGACGCRALKLPSQRCVHASSEGMVSSHLSPGFIICKACVQPLMTWLGAKVAGLPRFTLESKTVPSISVPV